MRSLPQRDTCAAGRSFTPYLNLRRGRSRAARSEENQRECKKGGRISLNNGVKKSILPRGPLPRGGTSIWKEGERRSKGRLENRATVHTRVQRKDAKTEMPLFSCPSKNHEKGKKRWLGCKKEERRMTPEAWARVLVMCFEAYRNGSSKVIFQTRTEGELEKKRSKQARRRGGYQARRLLAIKV